MQFTEKVNMTICYIIKTEQKCVLLYFSDLSNVKESCCLRHLFRKKHTSYIDSLKSKTKKKKALTVMTICPSKFLELNLSLVL